LPPILEYPRRVGATPELSAVSATTAAEELLERFARYLTVERALTQPVVHAYCHWVRPFVETVCCAGDAAVRGDLTSADISLFLVDRLPGLSKKSAQMTASSLRSFLRFLHSEGIVRSCLADAVLSPAQWRLSGLARPLDDGQLGALRGACDPSKPVGRRDLAVIAVLSRLGLRCAEAAALRLEDVDWPDGTITVHGKGNRTDRLPLPVDVGEAIVDYLCHGRPDTTARTVFVRVCAPHTALAPSSVSCIVARAARRAGLGTVHAHRLRHTAASRTLNTGASLEEVALLMRHAGPATTFGYAKTDQDRLARLARCWPTVGDPR
jgi:integrase/recombinase XerD